MQSTSLCGLRHIEVLRTEKATFSSTKDVPENTGQKVKVVRADQEKRDSMNPASHVSCNQVRHILGEGSTASSSSAPSSPFFFAHSEKSENISFERSGWRGVSTTASLVQTKERAPRTRQKTTKWSESDRGGNLMCSSQHGLADSWSIRTFSV